MYAYLFRILILVIILHSITFNECIFSQFLRCTLGNIEGCEKEAKLAYSILGKNTNHISNTKIFITVKDNSLYIHSNFIEAGSDYPTKILTSTQINSIDDIALNVFYRENPIESEWINLKNALKNDIKIIMNPKVIKRYKINFDNADNINFFCPDGIIRDGVKMYRNSNEYDFLIKYNEQILTRIKEENLDYILHNLKNEKIYFNEMKVLSMVDNSSTRELLMNKFKDNNIIFDFSSKNNFKKLLIENKDNMLIILSHIEEGNIVTVNPQGIEIFKISINEIQEIQKENNIQSIILGCNSAVEGANTGVIGKFNSVDALERLEKTTKAKNIEEFLNTLAYRTFHIVLDNTFFDVGKGTEKYNLINSKKIEFIVLNKTNTEMPVIEYSKLGKIIILTQESQNNLILYVLFGLLLGILFLIINKIFKKKLHEKATFNR
jgi:hypothetical protein